MRWLVEVTSLGRTEKDSLYVDADSWQKALQVARTLRGETEPMSGFSIELLEEGCRAVDPATRISYEVHRADERRVPSMRPPVAPRPPPAPVAPAPEPPVAAPAPETRRSQFPPRPQISAAATMALGSPAPAPVVAASSVAPVGSGSIAPATSSLASQIVYKREQDATEALPLTYREYVFVVPPGSSEMAAATLVQSQLELVRSSLDRMPAGKLVNLAVFDVSFQGRPTVPPLATLSWKDWRGVALVSFPRQPGRAPLTIPTGAPATAPVQPAPTPSVPNVFLPPLVNTQVPPAMASPGFPASAPVLAPAPVIAAPLANPFSPAITVAPSGAAASASSPPNPFATVPAPIISTAPAPTHPFAAAPAPAIFSSSNPIFAAPAQPTLSPAAPFTPQPLAPSGQALASAPVPAFAPSQAPTFNPPAMSEPSGSIAGPVSVRVYGEDLIADLFESMHDLHFSRDAVEGGDFCLALAMTKLPSMAGIVQAYDINKREFLVTNTRGAGAETLLLRRFADNDGILSTAMRKRRAVVIANAADSDAATTQRYAAIGGARSIVVAPVMQAGRFLGAIELVNPLDGEPFTESDGNAVSYIAEQLAEFIASHGIVTDPERISLRPHR
jgi:putative methionine-R-sulfoxide reductase with GAF domain